MESSNPDSFSARDDLARFILHLRHFVLDERDAQRRQIEKEWAKPLAERVADGFAIEGVRFIRLDPSGYVELACGRNQSRFREGDTLCLNRSSPFFQPNANVTLELDDETRLMVYLGDSPTFDLEFLRQQPESWVLDQGYMDLSHYVLDALAEAGDTRVGTQRILPLLLNRIRPSTDLARYHRATEFAESVGLNDDQTEALAQPCVSIMGWTPTADNSV